MNTTELYTPVGCKSLADTQQLQQIRLMIQGFPGTGKTWAALTFPNPVVLNLDRGLGAHSGRKDVIEVPFYDVKFVHEWMKKPSYLPSDMKDALDKWISEQGSQLTAAQTLVLDGNTGIQNAYHKWFKVNQNMFLTRSGEVDGFAEWRVKREFYGGIMESLKTLRCHVVFLCHEVDQKDKNGVQGPSYSGKVRPLLTGAFGDELGSHFTDVFRAHSTEVPSDFNTVKEEDIKKNWQMTKAEFQQWCKSFTQGTYYYWQTVSDSIFDAKASSLVNFPRYIPANFSSFEKFRRKTIS